MCLHDPFDFLVIRRELWTGFTNHRPLGPILATIGGNNASESINVSLQQILSMPVKILPGIPNRANEFSRDSGALIGCKISTQAGAAVEWTSSRGFLFYRRVIE